MSDIDRLSPDIIFDLQFFAEFEKTEEATPRQIREARKKGRVAKSQEISSAATLMVFFVFLNAFGTLIIGRMAAMMRGLFTHYLLSELTLQNIYLLSVQIFGLFLQVFVLFGLFIIFASFLSSYAQTGWLFTLETVKPELARLNPAASIKKIFSSQSAVVLLKTLCKILVVFYLTYGIFTKEWQIMLQTPYRDLRPAGMWLWKVIYEGGLSMGLFLLMIALADYGYQRWQYKKSLRMSRREIKEEYRETEGDPRVKERIRRKQMEFTGSRMMQEIRDADAIITNFMDLAVAVKYRNGIMNAPVLAAKGKGYNAVRILEAGEKAGITTVEDGSLAQELYKTVEPGDEIPPALYPAVAESLAYVFQLKEIKRERG